MDAGIVRQTMCPQIWLSDCKRYNVQEILDTLFSDGKNILYIVMFNINGAGYMGYLVMHCSVLHKM